MRALEDVLSPAFRKVLWRSIGLTIALFAGILLAVETGISFMTAFPWPWLGTVLAVATGLGIFAAFIFLMAPVTAVFAGFYLDEIAEIVETRDYAQDLPGRPISAMTGAIIAVQFGLLVLLVNLLLLPTLFFGIGAILMLIANAYLLGREYFSMVAMRHMPVRDAAMLRKANTGRIFTAAFIPAAIAMIPVVNILVPLFSTSYFVHIFKKIIHDQ